jgi:hypothetical protein
MRILPLLFVLFLSLFAAPARAEIEVGFWSREMGIDLPHAFITIRGTVDGKPVEESYGFTPKTVTPALLWGPVPGRIDLTTKSYMAASNKLFSIRGDDATYAKLKDMVARYSAKPGSIYRMNERNCVHFVAEAAVLVGLRAPDAKGLMKRPTSFLMAVANANRDFPTLKLEPRKK